MKYILSGIALLTLIIISCYLILNHIEEPYELNEIIRQNTGDDFVGLSRGQVRYELSGDSSQDFILFLGGSGLGMEIWDRNIKNFQQAGYQCLRYDYYGRGFSDQLKNTPLSVELYTQQVLELLDKLKLKNPDYIISFSLGGEIVFPLMKKLNGRLKKVVLISPIGSREVKREWYYTIPGLIDLMMTFYWSPQALNKQMNEFYAQELFTDYREKLKYQMKIKGYKKSQLSIWLNALSTDVKNEITEAGKSDAEFLLIWGLKDWRNPILNSEYYLNNIDHIKMVQVENAGHPAQYEQADEVNKIINNFLGSH